MHTNLKFNGESQSYENKLLKKEFWSNFEIKLNIEKINFKKKLILSKKLIDEKTQKLQNFGYFHYKNPNFFSPINLMFQTLKRINDMNLPPVFGFVYDEFWYIQYQIENLLNVILGKNYKQLPDFWAWCITRGKSGWSPHRDKGSKSLFDNNKPKSVTVWIPLSKATPENSCMYILPADKDKYYNKPKPLDSSNDLPGKIADFKALPADPGDLLIWTQEVYHWGSSSDLNHTECPRVSIAFEFQRGDITPFRDFILEPNVLPTFEERLVLISMQILQYTHMYGFKSDLVFWAKNCIERYKNLNKL